MKKLILFAGAAGLFLVSAATPGAKEGELSSVLAAPAPMAATPPAPMAESAPAPIVTPAPAPVTQVAEARTSYPRCSSTVQDRCVQGRGSRAYAPASERRIQLASRAGERG
ncbi:MAG TPA: hypothetical protein VGC35_07985 [Allosphingosinicella sp.]|jgi:septal ring-binding cell division protein DamX